MKKNKLFKIFLRNLIRTTSMMILLIAVAFGSFQLTMIVYKDSDSVGDSKAGELIKDIVSDVEVDTISKNLIYCVDKGTGKITKMVIEIFNTTTNNLDYVTVPADTKFTISEAMYQRLCVAIPEAPQIIQFSEIDKYFSEKTVYDYGQILMEDLLGVDISYYTVLDSEVYDTIFEEQEKTITYQPLSEEENTVESMKIQMVQETYLQKFKEAQESGELKDFVKGWCDIVDSNLTEKNKLKYLESYEKIDGRLIYYHGIYGGDNGSNFVVAVSESQELMNGILENETYTISQREFHDNTDLVSSVGRKIEILNASNISGLAAAYQSKLTDAGYTVEKIGNYSGSILTETKIIVAEEGIGQDLLKFFKGAQLEMGQLEEGQDIQIILGTSDKL